MDDVKEFLELVETTQKILEPGLRLARKEQAGFELSDEEISELKKFTEDLKGLYEEFQLRFASDLRDEEVGH